QEPYKPSYSSFCTHNSIHLKSGFYSAFGDNISNNVLKPIPNKLVYPFVWKSREFYTCSDILDTITLTQITHAQVSKIDTITCTNNPITLTTGDDSSQVIWSTGDTAQTITVNYSGIYTAFIRKANCVFYDTAYVTFYNAPRIKPLDTTFCPEDSAISLQAISSWPIEWSNGDTTQLAKFEAGVDFWLKIKDPFCPAIDTFRLEVDCSNQLFIPNAFTPNGDAFNPEFIAKGTKIENFEMRIFARNGQLVFYSNNLEDGWDGSSNGQPLPLGKYLYIIEVEIEGETQKHAGTIHLIK
ncbi:MAG: gliding motility-associated C-terminal domain-containing protein, partial [Bacteroidetes bacterium]|nr:gliding motility-associated C-terminal domain-containing protein [Bacteroidota bacterium]